MKASRIFSIVFVIFGFMSCQTKEKNENIILTDFTKELISLYLNDDENLDAKNRVDEIIIRTYADTLSYYLNIHSNNSKSYDYCSDDFLGDTVYLGHIVRVFGDENLIFYSVKEKVKTQTKCNDYFIEYDPNVWCICLYKDLSFCKMRTYKITADADIFLIQDLVGKYFKISDTICGNDDFIYQWWEIESEPNPPFSKDYLRHFVSSNFKITKRINIEEISDNFAAQIVVDKNGNASFNEIETSGNKEIDREAIRIANIICQYKFTPAIHRGEKVNSTYYIVFFKDDIVRAQQATP